jgi:uncharacterized protein YecT (DUF1311 family)
LKAYQKFVPSNPEEIWELLRDYKECHNVECHKVDEKMKITYNTAVRSDHYVLTQLELIQKTDDVCEKDKMIAKLQ